MATSTVAWASGATGALAGHYVVAVTHPGSPNHSFSPRFLHPVAPPPGYVSQAAYETACQTAATALVDAVMVNVAAGWPDATYHLMSGR